MTRFSRRAALAVAGAAVLAGAAVTLRPGAPQAASAMSPPEVLDAVRRGEILLVDIRRPDEWRETGLAEGAVAIDMRRDDFTTALAVARSGNARPVALICARGVRSRRLTARLVDAGIGPIIDVPEGMLGSRDGPGWLARALPTRLWSEQT